MREVNPFDMLDKRKYTTEEISKERLAICETCPRLFKATKTCKECGCFMTAKTKLKNAVCPLGKWGAVEE